MNAKKYDITIASKSSSFEMTKINNSKDAEQYARQFFHEDISLYESVFVMFLNRANKVIGYAKISQGGTISSIIDNKIILKYALDCLASGIILIHNHPSGNTSPSEQDKKHTKILKDACVLFDITLLDHIILTEKEYYSFSDN